jgi:UDP:flavonoid glycosyltransferase YjiC (YdhE family)
LGLLARGHRVRVIANPYFAPLIERVGLEFLPAGTSEEYQQLAKDPALWRGLRGTRLVMQSLGNSIRPVYEAIVNCHVPNQTVVAASSLGLGARIAEDHLGIPTATIHLQPAILLSALRPPKLPGTFMPPWMPTWMKRIQLGMIDRLTDPIIAPVVNGFRHELGLAPVKRILRQYLHSPRRVIGLFPEWFAPPAPDWPSQVRLSGFPLFDERDSAAMPQDLLGFLDAGEAPIAFTPGSAMWTGQQFFAQSVRACQQLGVRGILLSRHPDHLPASLPSSVMHVPYAPFSQLLPRCAALVHHGGIGTSAQALAAGIPQLVVPHAHDQPDNAARLVALGVARKVGPRRFRADVIARELPCLLQSECVRVQCRQTAARFVGVDAVAQTCDLIEELLIERAVPSRLGM